MKKIETREHVQAFLNSFLPKFDIWGIFFIDRKKNDEAIAALGITPAQRGCNQEYRNGRLYRNNRR